MKSAKKLSRGKDRVLIDLIKLTEEVFVNILYETNLYKKFFSWKLFRSSNVMLTPIRRGQTCSV